MPHEKVSLLASSHRYGVGRGSAAAAAVFEALLHLQSFLASS